MKHDVMSHPAVILQPHSIIAVWLGIISHLMQGRRLSWPGWLVAYQGGLPAWRQSPIPVITGPDVQYR